MPAFRSRPCCAASTRPSTATTSARRRREKINSLAYCSQDVLAAAEDMKEAAVGAADGDAGRTSQAPDWRKGLSQKSSLPFLRRNADLLEAAKLPQRGGVSARSVALEAARVAAPSCGGNRQQETRGPPGRPGAPPDRARRKTFRRAAGRQLPTKKSSTVRAEADRDLAPYRRKMSAAQIDQLQKQYVHKRLLEKYGLPRLSLFYM